MNSTVRCHLNGTSLTIPRGYVVDQRFAFDYGTADVQLSSIEGPIAIGPDRDMIWFARGRVVVVVPQNMTGGRPEAVARVRERYEELGEPLALTIVIKDGSERPDEETRDDIRRAFDEMSPTLVCNSITVLGSGFFKSFFISIVSQTLSLTRRHGGAYRLHTNLESTASWMHEQLSDPNVSLEEVLETLHWAIREEQSLGAASSSLSPS